MTVNERKLRKEKRFKARQTKKNHKCHSGGESNVNISFLCKSMSLKVNVIKCRPTSDPVTAVLG